MFSAKKKLLLAKLRTVKVCAESLISRVSPRKRSFQQNHFSLSIRGPGGLFSWWENAKTISASTLFYFICTNFPVISKNTHKDEMLKFE